MSASREPTEPERDALGALPFFDLMPESTAQELLARTGVIRVDAGRLLFCRGDPADRFFVVLRGRVRLFALDREGREQTIHDVEPVQSFAEAAILGDQGYPVHAEVVADSDLAAVPAAPLLAALRRDPAMALGMLAGMAQWQRFLMDEIRTLRAVRPDRRLAGYLLALVESGRWSGRAPLPMRKVVIASRIGIEPESLSRALRRLEAAGILEAGGEVRLADPEALRRFCAG